MAVHWNFVVRDVGKATEKQNRGPVLLRGGPRIDFERTDSRDYALAGKSRFRRAMIPTASSPSAKSGSAPGSGTFTGGLS